MAGERVKLEVKERERRGSQDARRLRREGLIPGVLYGNGKQAHAFCVPERELRRVLTGAGGTHAILDVVVEGKKTVHPSILKEAQRDRLRDRLIHVDLLEVRLDRAIQATVSVQLIGEAQGSKEGGVLSQVTREVTVEALPMEIPEHLELDVSGMAIGDTLRIADLPVSEGVRFVDDPDAVLATVTMPTRVVEPEEMLEEGEEGEEAGAPEGGAEAPAEPEAQAAGGEGATEG
jgi:large subunit ribosomal protein L25